MYDEGEAISSAPHPQQIIKIKMAKLVEPFFMLREKNRINHKLSKMGKEKDVDDPGSLPVRLCIIGLMIGIHGFFTAVNTAMSSAGRIIEKYQAAIRLLQILTCAGGEWLSAGDAWLVFVYLVLFTVLGQYFPHKIGLQHDQGITEKMAGFIEALSAV
ncbi:MAG: U32 family peptidase C-terminal domain-containing protein [Anaerovoracaceae bacterium]